MKMLLSAVAFTAMVASSGAYAQTRLDHDVQKAWDDVFHPEQRGSPQTDWERRRDGDRYAYDRERRREYERAEWCRYHPGACERGPGYGRPDERPYER